MLKLHCFQNRLPCLQTLHRAVTLSNSQPTDCVLIDKTQDGRQQIGKRKVYPHVIACQLWRWPDVIKSELARATDNCKWSFFDRRECVCINPYHYIRIKPTIEPDNSHPVNSMNNYSCRYGPSNYFQTNTYSGHYEAQSAYGETVTDIGSFLGNKNLAYGEEIVDLDPLLPDENSGYFGDALTRADLFYGTGQSQSQNQTVKNDELILPTPAYQFLPNSPSLPQNSYNFPQGSPGLPQNSNYSQGSPTSQPSPLTNNSPLHNPNSPLIQPKSPNFVVEDKPAIKNSPVYQPPSPAQFQPAQTSPAAYQQMTVNHQQSVTAYQQPSTSQQQNAPPTFLQLSQARPNLPPVGTNSGSNCKFHLIIITSRQQK